MITRCPHCNAELGPWESDSGCLSCQPPWRWTLADQGIAVLETAELPLYRWDIRREVRLQYGLAVRENSLGSSLAGDWRACWAGPGLYGLYRHGLLPGVRDIGTAAGILIHVSDRPLNVDEIRFILRHVGYRVTASSIPHALYRAEANGLYTANWGTYVGRANSEPQQRAAARAMGLGRRGPVFREIAARAAQQVADALHERQRRLEGGARLSRPARRASNA